MQLSLSFVEGQSMSRFILRGLRLRWAWWLRGRRAPKELLFHDKVSDVQCVHAG